MIPGLGWSASDLVLAVKVIHKVCSAFRNAGGANEQYDSTVAFLDAFARTLERISQYIQSISFSKDGTGLSDDLTAQMKLIYTEYKNFDEYLKKVEPGLSSASFASRITARAKWAIKEINQKVEGLKKAVISPMMFVAPLLAVEVLRELKELRSQLPASSASQEAALRENRALILQANSDLAHLRSNLESYWWNRRWAMSAVEQSVKSLTLAIKNNTALIEASDSSIQDTVSKEVSQACREQAATNIATISALEGVMESRLSSIEAQIDLLISEGRRKTGSEDKELYYIKTRISASRQHLNVAVSSGRECLKHFGLLVFAVNSMHKNPMVKLMLPLAGMLVGYDQICEHGQKMVKAGGKSIKEGGQYVEESKIMTNLKSWNSFTAAVSTEKNRLSTTVGRTALDASNPDRRDIEHTNAEPPKIEDNRHDSGKRTEDEGDQPISKANLMSQDMRTVTSKLQRVNGRSQSHNEALYDAEAEAEANVLLPLLDLDQGSESRDVHPPVLTSRIVNSYEPVAQVSQIPVNEITDNPWA